MQLIYKFFLKTDTGRVYIETEAEDKDGQWIYVKNGKIPRHLIDGEISEEWVTSVDSQLQQSQSLWVAATPQPES